MLAWEIILGKWQKFIYIFFTLQYFLQASSCGDINQGLYQPADVFIFMFEDVASGMIYTVSHADLL